MDKELEEIVKAAIEQEQLSYKDLEQIGKIRGSFIGELEDGKYFILAEATVRLPGETTTFYDGDSVVEGDEVTTAYLEYEVTTHGLEGEPDVKLTSIQF